MMFSNHYFNNLLVSFRLKRYLGKLIGQKARQKACAMCVIYAVCVLKGVYVCKCEQANMSNWILF